MFKRFEIEIAIAIASLIIFFGWASIAFGGATTYNPGQVNIGGLTGTNFGLSGPGVTTSSNPNVITITGGGGGGSSTVLWGVNGVTVTALSGGNQTSSLDQSFSASWTAIETFIKGVTINGTTTVASTTNALLSANTLGQITTYLGSSCGGGQFASSISATGTVICGTPAAGGFTNANASSGIAISTSTSLISIQNIGATSVNGATGTVTISSSSLGVFTNTNQLTNGAGFLAIGSSTFVTTTTQIIAGGTATGNIFTLATSSLPYFTLNCTVSTCTFTGIPTSTILAGYSTSTASGGVATTTLFSAGFLPVVSSSLAITNSSLYMNATTTDLSVGTTTDLGTLGIWGSLPSLILRYFNTGQFGGSRIDFEGPPTLGNGGSTEIGNQNLSASGATNGGFYINQVSATGTFISGVIGTNYASGTIAITPTSTFTNSVSIARALNASGTAQFGGTVEDNQGTKYSTSTFALSSLSGVAPITYNNVTGAFGFNTSTPMSLSGLYTFLGGIAFNTATGTSPTSTVSAGTVTAATGTYINLYTTALYDDGATTTACLANLFDPTTCVNTLNGLWGNVIATGTTNQITVATDTGNLVIGISANYAPSTTIPTNTNQLTNGAGFITTSTNLTVKNFATTSISQWNNDAGYATSTSATLTGGQNPYVPYWITGSTLGTSTLYFDAPDGRIGIGTTTPPEILSIYKPAGQFDTIRYDSGGTQGYFYSYSGDNSVNIGSNSASQVNLKVGNSTMGFLDTSNQLNLQEPSGSKTIQQNLAPVSSPQESTISLIRIASSSATNREFTDITDENYNGTDTTQLDGGIDHAFSINIAASGTGEFRPFLLRFWNPASGTVAAAAYTGLSIIPNTNNSSTQPSSVAASIGGTLNVSSTITGPTINTLASSSWKFVIGNATTTNNLSNYTFWQTDQTVTISKFECFDTAATTSLIFFQTKAYATSTISSTIASFQVCGTAGSSTALNVTFPANANLAVEVSSTAGTPLSTPVQITYTKQ